MLYQYWLLEIIKPINKDKIQNSNKSTGQHAGNEESTDLSKPDTNTELKTDKESGCNLNFLRELGQMGKTIVVKRPNDKGSGW